MINPTNLERLVRPNILDLKPYSSARDEFQSGAQAAVFLDANENSLGGPFEEDFSRYPDPRQGELKMALATLKGVLPEQIFLGNGSDEAIDLLLRAFCVPGLDNILILPPTYGMYAVQAGIQDVEVRRAPLRPDFSPDVKTVLEKVDERSKILFLCSPNNPTGNALPEGFLLEMLRTFPGLVVVDEAYGDFSEQDSVLPLLADFPNLVVLQTFSKAWGLAALRIGMAYSNPFVINVLNKIKYPYNLNILTTGLALKALERKAAVGQKIALLLSERARLTTELVRLPMICEVFPSEANFLLVRTTDADGIYQFLCEHGIVVRNRTRELHCDNCLRITVGSPTQNDRLLETLRNFPTT